MCLPRDTIKCHVDVVRPNELAKVHEGMPREISSGRVCCAIAMMDYHVRHHWTMCAAKGPCGHATPDVVRSCVLSMGDDNMPRPRSSDRMCCLMYIMSCHARRQYFMCATQGLRGIPRLTSSVHVCSPKSIRHAMSSLSYYVFFPKGNIGWH